MTYRSAARMAKIAIMKKTGLSEIEALELLNEILDLVYKANEKEVSRDGSVTGNYRQD